MHFIGNTLVASELNRLVAGSDFPSVTLLIGPSGVGKQTLARMLAAQLLSCDVTALDRHPDFQICARADEGLSVESLRDMRTRAGSYGFIGGAKVIVIDAIDTLTPSSANVLLKLLEEPGNRTYFFLCGEQYHRVLPTIRSRAAIVELNACSDDELREVFKEYAHEQFFADALALAVGRPGVALRLLSDAEYREKVFAIKKEFVGLIGSNLVARLATAEHLTPKGDHETMQENLFELLTWWEVCGYGILKDAPSSEWALWLDALADARHALHAHASSRTQMDRLVLTIPTH